MAGGNEVVDSIAGAALASVVVVAEGTVSGCVGGVSAIVCGVSIAGSLTAGFVSVGTRRRGGERVVATAGSESTGETCGTGGGGISVSVAVRTVSSGATGMSTGQNVHATCTSTDIASASKRPLRTGRGVSGDITAGGNGFDRWAIEGMTGSGTRSSSCVTTARRGRVQIGRAHV